jgi:putative DNA primase/helicase
MPARPCPRCGGDDRLSINPRKGLWNCRGCEAGGDVIKSVQHLDGVDFRVACGMLTDQQPPESNDKKGTQPRKVHL